MAEKTRLFVLDTNVLMHDPSALFKFEEHDIYLPMAVMEELDSNKKGMNEVSRNVREATRVLAQLIEKENFSSIEQGISLNKVTPLIEDHALGRLFFQVESFDSVLQEDIPRHKADTHILGTVRGLEEKYPGRSVTLVTKDINLRIKAGMLGIHSEDYINDQVLEDADLLYKGVEELPLGFFDREDVTLDSWQREGYHQYQLNCDEVSKWFPGLCLFSQDHGEFCAIVRSVDGNTAILEHLRNYQTGSHNIWGIQAKNFEQNCAMNIMMHPDIDFVTLLGQAGTGKTILALACALEMVLEQKRFDEIIMTRATIPVGEDIGFLPGTEEEKMKPWMGALMDNLESLLANSSGNKWEQNTTQEMVSEKVKIKSMSFMRGRSFIRKLVIIDEAQNLTSKQMKTLITRAGEGTKLICLGNIAQIDSPYLTETTSGLTYVVDKFKRWEHSAHITLKKAVRSRLAEYASENL
jgi:PhoH-like ATPase